MSATNRTQGLHTGLLNAVTATGAGAAVVLPEPLSRFTSYATVTGAPTAVSAILEGSLDGTSWFPMNSHSAGGVLYFTSGPVKYVRGNLATLTGGTTPTVTLWVAGSL